MKTGNKKNKRALSRSPAKKRVKRKIHLEDAEETRKANQLSVSESSDEIEDSTSAEDSISSESSESEDVQRKQKRRKGRTKSSSESESLSSDTDSRSDDEEVLTRKTFVGDLEANVGKKNEPKCLYRSNINPAVRELRRLTFTDNHLELLRLSPFWLLIDAILRVNTKKKLAMSKKKDQDVRKIIKMYSRKRECFMIGGEKVKLRNQDFRLTFGICDGTRVIDEYLNMGLPEWVKSCFEAEIEAKGKKRFSLERSVIYRKLAVKVQSVEKRDVEDAVRLVNCYMLAALLITNQNGSMKNEVAALFEKLDEAVFYNWSSYMTGLLIRHIKSTGGNTKTIGGCAMILPYFLCEHSKILKATNPLEFPRFLKWDLQKFHKKFSKMDVSKIKGVKGKVIATSEEMDAFDTQFQEQAVVIRKIIEKNEVRLLEKGKGEKVKEDEGVPLVHDNDKASISINETREEEDMLLHGDKNVEYCTQEETGRLYSVNVVEECRAQETSRKKLLDSDEEYFLEDTIDRVVQTMDEQRTSMDNLCIDEHRLCKEMADDMREELNELKKVNKRLQDEVDELRKEHGIRQEEVCKLKAALEDKAKEREAVVNDKDLVI